MAKAIGNAYEPADIKLWRLDPPQKSLVMCFCYLVGGDFFVCVCFVCLFVCLFVFAQVEGENKYILPLSFLVPNSVLRKKKP